VTQIKSGEKLGDVHKIIIIPEETGVIYKKVGPVIESLGLKDKSPMPKVESSILHASQLLAGQDVPLNCY
jgi:hypothetical protein